MRKYIPALDLLYINENDLNFYNFNVFENWKAMNMHYSQFVWYRKLFVLYSRYSYFNNLAEIK